MPSLEERFWPKVDKSGDCWLWLGSTWHYGYGCIYVAKPRKAANAHRVSYEMANGPIPKGLFVLHRCDNPRCVRPSHLFLGTQMDNVRDMVNKGRERFSHRGEKHPSVKLSESEVIDIRRQSARGQSQRSIAREYGVTRSAITGILHKRTWGWLLDTPCA